MDKKTPDPLKSTNKKRPLLRIYLLIGFVAAVTVGSMGFIFYLGNRMVAGCAPMIDAAMEIKLEATTGHLRLEEMISGDRDQSIEDVLKHIDQADWYAQAMLEGGQNAEGKFVPLKDPGLRQEIEEVREKLREFKDIARRRLQSGSDAGIVAEIDQQCAAVFRDFILQADRVETHLQQLIGRGLAMFRIVQTALIAICLIATVAVGVVLGRSAGRRIRDEMALRAANQQLGASEQQLRAANQQLVASEQQLRANGQELRRERDRAQTYLDVAGVMFVAIDSEQRIDLINRKGCQVLGYDESEIIGKNWFDFCIPERQRAPVKEAFQALISGEIEPVEYFENPVLTRDGEERLISWHNTVLRDDEGNIVLTFSSGEDITQRKQAEEQLRQKDYIIESASSAIVTADLDGKLTYANPVFLEMWGFDNPEEFLGRHFTEYWMIADKFDEIMNALRNDGEWTDENQARRKDGSIFDVQVSAAMVRDGEGNPVGLMSSSADITERKRAEEALRAERDKLKALMDGITRAGIGIDIVGADHRVLFQNETLEQRFGEIHGEPCYKHYMSLEEPCDRCPVAEAIQQNAAVEVEQRGLDGRDYQIFSAPVPEADGSVSKAVEIVLDITERKQAEEARKISEQRLELAHDAAGMGMFDWDIVQDKAVCNERYFGLFGLEPKERMLSREDWSAMVHLDDRQRAQDEVRQTLEERAPYDTEYRVVWPDGPVKWVSSKAKVFHDDDGKPCRMIGAMTDITEQKQAEEAIHQSEEQLSLIYNTTTDIMLLFSVEPEGEFRIVSHNQAFDRLMAEACIEQGAADGVSLEKFFRETLQLSPEDAAYRLEKYREAARTREIGRFEGTTNLPNLGEVVHDTTLHPVLDQHNECTHVLAVIENITERKRAEEKLREKERHYRTLIESSHEVIFSKDRDGRYHSLNLNAAIGLGGTCIDDIAGKTDYDLLPSEQAATLQETDNKVMESGKTVEAEEVVSNAQGHERIYLSRKWPTYDDEGRISGIGCFAVDITERKRAEAERARLIDILEATSDFVSTSTPDGELTYLNRAGRRMLGWPEDEAFDGREIPDVHPDWAFHIVKNEGIPAAIEHGTWEGETALLRSDGTEIPVSQVIMAHKSPAGQVEYLSTIIRDIAERKRAEEELKKNEEKYRQFYEDAPLGYQSLDIRGNFLDVNGEWLRILGYSKEDVIGRCFMDFVAPEYLEVFAERFSRFKAAGKARGNEFEMLRKDGSRITVSFNGNTEIDQEGHFRRTHCIMHDITEQKKRARESALYRNRLRSLVSELTTAEDRERKNIASLLHDDVLQKLALSKMKLGMLRETLTSSDQMGALDNVHEYVSEMFRDMRSLTFDLCPPVLYDIGLEAAVRDWVQKELVDKHGITVHIETEGQPLHLCEDVRVALYRAAREVLVNTIKHAKAHEVSVTFAYLDHEVKVEVRDDGIGFDRARAEADEETSGGLGLFTIRERLEYFGGSLEIESEPDKGSCVAFAAALTDGGELNKETEHK